MRISKERLIQIIKEELQSEDTAGTPLYPVKDIDKGAQLQRGDDLVALKDQLVTLLSTLQHNDAVDILMGVASDLGLHPPEEEEEAPSEYGAETGMGFVKTREDLERMIGDELVALLGESGE